ncbi:MAG TPA: methyl coenzyme M reductase system, component A2 [Methanoregulaceae archaeon]|nr:methyl coenzyme M reductase system, component A2 [Methanoregulaceae archaeon]HPW10958.1 methyl coenzyme M reductase system, component A2 [Methanoregulaceae archaeon]HQM56529.1 methyl coenzyme M reductase system, component A2 [Methanoregulaceae archaeon]
MSGSPSPLLTVRNLSIELGGTLILDNVSFHMNEGEVLGIIGRSGAGKSILMHLMRGIDDPPTSGAVIYHMSQCQKRCSLEPRSAEGMPCPGCGGALLPVDIDLWNPDDERGKSLILRKTAIMFQRTFALYGNDRVIENVLHALDDIRYPPDQSVNRAAELLERVRMTHRMMHIARDLSGGEKQRVVLARQLAKEPLLLFADEPTGTLDPTTAHLVHQLLLDATSNSHMGMVITSHFSGVIDQVADRALLMDKGRVIEEGSPTKILGKFMQNYHAGERVDSSENGAPILQAREVMKRYITADRGLIKAVTNVTFDVAEREIFGIIGTSGAGKTTLSRIIAGLIEPTGGEMNIRIGDDWVDMTSPGIENRGRAKPYIGLLHQEYDLYPHRTILDNLTDAIGLEFPKELAIQKAVISLKMAGFAPDDITTFLHRYPAELSQGERHRVALAQVLIREPRIVVLDEPTGTMDPITKLDVKHSILTARKEMDETFIIVSHDMDFVQDICDRVALMKGGKVIHIGPPSEIPMEFIIPASDREASQDGIREP